MTVQSVQFSCSVMSNSLWPHELQHTSLPCPSPPPGVFSKSRSSSQWCHPAISSSVFPFSSCLQSFPAPGSFPRSQFLSMKIWGSDENVTVVVVWQVKDIKNHGKFMPSWWIYNRCILLYIIITCNQTIVKWTFKCYIWNYISIKQIKNIKEGVKKFENN